VKIGPIPQPPDGTPLADIKSASMRADGWLASDRNFGASRECAQTNSPAGWHLCGVVWRHSASSLKITAMSVTF